MNSYFMANAIYVKLLEHLLKYIIKFTGNGET